MTTEKTAQKEETKKINKKVVEEVKKENKKESAKKEKSKKVRKEESKKTDGQKPKENKAVKSGAKHSKKADKKVKAKKDIKLRYYEAVGRRKSSTARVRIYTRGEEITVNGKNYKEYFPVLAAQKVIEDSLVKMKSLGKFSATVKVKGGGKQGQAEAIRHGLARTLVLFNADFRKRLKRAGYLKRDPRVKERKKFGLRRARRAPQWSKR